MGRLFELEKHAAKLVLMSALSQQPFTKRDSSNGQLFYRPYDIDRLLNLLEVPVASAEPVMTHQFVLRFGTEELKDSANSRLESFTLNGRPVFDTGSTNETSLLVGCGHFNGFRKIPGQFCPTITAPTNSRKPVSSICFTRSQKSKAGATTRMVSYGLSSGNTRFIARKYPYWMSFPPCWISIRSSAPTWQFRADL